MQGETCPTTTLNNGTEMPVIGFGVFNPDGSDFDVVRIVKTAILDHGYRHFDGDFYFNEEALG